MTNILAERTALVHYFLDAHRDWFDRPENSFYGSNSLVSAFLLAWAKKGAFPDDWSDSRLIYVQGKFEEYLATAPRPMYLLSQN